MMFPPDVLRRYLAQYEANVRRWLRVLETGPASSERIQRKPFGMPEAVCLAEVAGLCRARCVSRTESHESRSEYEWTITDAGRDWLKQHNAIDRIGEAYLESGSAA